MKHLFKNCLAVFFIVAIAGNLKAQVATPTPPATPAVPADTSYWTNSGTFAINLTNTALSNWQGGGQNSLALGGLFNYTAKYEKGKHLWLNIIEAAYGAQRLGDTKGFQKTDDLLHFNSTYGRKLRKKWYLSATFDLRSQIAVGEESKDIDGDEIEKIEKISSFFAPAFFNIGIGLAYKHSWDKEDFFSANFQPVSLKMTYVGDQSVFDGFPVDSKAYGLNRGESLHSEFGLLTMNFQFQRKLADNIRVVSALNLFTPYDKAGDFDVNWDVLFTAKVNKWLGMSFQYSLIYDDDVISKIQSKSVLGAGLTLTI